MSRVLLVSRNLSFGFGLGGAYDVVEDRPFKGWTLPAEHLDGVDAVVLDLGDTGDPEQVVGDVRAADFSGPILLLTEPGQGLTGAGSGQVHVLELPVSGAQLKGALDDMVVDKPRRPKKTRSHEPPRARPQPADDNRTPEPVVPRQRAGADARALVRALSAAVDQLRSVADVTGEMLADALTATGSDAGAVLVPDGGYWRVMAGVGIRHVEWRLALEPASWIVDEIAVQRYGVVVEGTDIARQRLSGVPLASWDSLMAAPMDGSDVIVLVARKAGSSPFVTADLDGLVQATRGYCDALADAFDLRRLARMLQRYTDIDTLD